MSWLFKSIQFNDSNSSSPESPTNRVNQDPTTPLSDAITRQLRGVANFLAPPPSPPSSSSSSGEVQSEPSDSQSQGLVGIRNDLAELGGSLKSGLSLLSTNKAVTEISRFTSNILQFESNSSNYADEYDDDEEEDDDVVEISDEVIEFVKEISSRPECWTDFPLSLPSDFKMSDAQRDHASTIEHFVPSLAVLRANLTSYMEDEQFWMIYFILLLPRLNTPEIEVLSTPQIVETRNILLQMLQNKRNAKVEQTSEHLVTLDTSRESGKNEIIHEIEVPEIANMTEMLGIDDEENADQWLEETEIDTNLDQQQKPEHEEDVSFSDLEDDGNDLLGKLSGSTQAQETTRVPSPDWIQLSESIESQGGLQKARQPISREKDSDGESSDWLKVEDFD